MSTHPRSTFRHPQSAILLICLLAFALRLGPAFDNRFHPDEALFSSWALKIAHGENILLTNVPVDKPPLLIYLTAISFFVLGQAEIAARFINIVASVISVALLYRLTRSHLGIGRLVTHRPVDPLPHRSIDRLTVFPSLLFALSPFAILFAPTAFLDPTMIMLGLASLVAASRGRAGQAGILFGLSFAAKVQGLFFAPLVLVYWSTRRSVSQGSGIGDRSPHLSVSPSLRLSIRFFAGWLAVIALVLAWDRLRGGVPFWLQQTINYGGIRAIYPSEVWPRLKGWISLLPYFLGPIVGAIGLIGLSILVYFDLTRDARTRPAFIDLALLTYLIMLFALHWLLAFPVWDRYFLILLPTAALLVGRSISQSVNWSMGRLANGSPRRLVILSRVHRIADTVQVSRHLVTAALILAAVLPYSLAAAESQYPIGGDHGAYDGIEQIAAYLEALPSGTVVYDHWLAWELSYYLGEGHVYLKYFDTPSDFAEDLRVFAKDDDRYVIFPARESPAKVIEAMNQVGYTLSPAFSTTNRFQQTSFTVFKIMKRHP